MSKWILLQITTLLLFLFFMPALSKIFAGSNLAPNPSFEAGNNTPEAWTTTKGVACDNSPTTPPLTFEWNNTLAVDGTHSLALRNILWPSGNTFTPGTWTSNPIPINVPPQEYMASLSVLGSNINTNLLPILWICNFDSRGNSRGAIAFTVQSPPTGPNWILLKQKISKFRDPTVSQIRLGFAAKCYTAQPCSGSVWFDNITLAPIGDITTHVFEDLNENGIQELGEQSLKQHRVSFYKGFDCQEPPGYFQNSPTDVNGNTIAKDLPFDNYSVKQDFNYYPGFPEWKNTTPSCQDITLQDSNPPAIQIGATKAPSFPYFSQLDPVWANQEYDHASQTNPFFCGYTIGGCGCAITSAAMLLNFHGATKSPNGENTTPDSLNTWLKDNNGYAFGALKWNSVAAYSVKANKTFGTQKIKFMGTSPANDFATLDLDLSRNNPQILQEPGHFIVTNAKQTQTYSIKDPAYEQKKTLSEYSNSFLSSRRFEKTNTDLSAIYISTPTPNELFLTDPQGRRVGKDPEEGIVYLEIPNSFYFLEPALTDQSQENPITPQESVGVNTLVIINPQPGDFTMHSNLGPIDFSAYDREGEIKTMEQSSETTETFEIIYSPEPGASFRVIQKVEIDIKPRNQNHGNGVLPIAILSDTNFDAQTVDFQSIQITPSYVSPIRVPLFISRSTDKLKDLLIFFEVNGLSSNINQELCLEGMTKDGKEFKGCNSP